MLDEDVERLHYPRADVRVGEHLPPGDRGAACGGHARRRPGCRSRSTRSPLPRTEISRELYMSLATVKAHVSRILEKLALNNRVQIALLAHDAGET